MTVIEYKLSKGGIGLLAYLEGGSYYHIHASELTRLEKWILKLLKKVKG